eukprot:g13592.t1.3.5e17418b g13592  g13592.t1 contig82:79516-81229(+)
MNEQHPQAAEQPHFYDHEQEARYFHEMQMHHQQMQQQAYYSTNVGPYFYGADAYYGSAYPHQWVPPHQMMVYHGHDIPPIPTYPHPNEMTYAPSANAVNRQPSYPTTMYRRSSSAGSYESLGSFRNDANGNNRGGSKKRQGCRSGNKKQPVQPQQLQSLASDESKYDDGMTLHEIKGRIASVAKEQDGSRFIQTRLQLAHPSELQLAYDEVLPVLQDLWNDAFGNFILQSLLEFGTEKMKAKLAEKLREDAVSLASKTYGCRVIQTALHTLGKTNVANLVSAFKGNVVNFIHDLNGNHVVQAAATALAKHLKEEEEAHGMDIDDNGDTKNNTSLLMSSTNIIIDEVVNDLQTLSRHSYGCRVVQRMVEHFAEAQKSRVLDAIIACHTSLFDDVYGNYVIQCVVSNGRPADRDIIFQYITVNNNVMNLSKKKQASNVVETMLRHGDADQRKKIVQRMLDCSFMDKDFIKKSGVVSMAEDAYANYVLKTVLEVLEEGEQRDALFAVLASSLEELVS